MRACVLGGKRHGVTKNLLGFLRFAHLQQQRTQCNQCRGVPGGLRHRHARLARSFFRAAARLQEKRQIVASRDIFWFVLQGAAYMRLHRFELIGGGQQNACNCVVRLEIARLQRDGAAKRGERVRLIALGAER